MCHGVAPRSALDTPWARGGCVQRKHQDGESRLALSHRCCWGGPSDTVNGSRRAEAWFRRCSWFQVFPGLMRSEVDWLSLFSTSSACSLQVMFMAAWRYGFLQPWLTGLCCKSHTVANSGWLGKGARARQHRLTWAAKACVLQSTSLRLPSLLMTGCPVLLWLTAVDNGD